jgi:hypothetical protein
VLPSLWLLADAPVIAVDPEGFLIFMEGGSALLLVLFD